MLVELSEVTLEVQLHSSSSANSKTLILSHPHPLFGGTMTNKVIDQIYRRSVERDWSVLRYNMRGFGKSTGTHDKGRGEEKDLLELIEWVGKQGVETKDMLLIGYSFGSWLTAKVTAQLQKPTILIAPPVTMYEFPVLNFTKPKVIFSAEKDELIDVTQIEKYYASISDPKQFISIPGADHYFIGTTSQLIKQVFQTIDQMGMVG